MHIGYLRYLGSDEYVRIDNIGGAVQNMTGWRIWSVVGDQTYYFPTGYTLEAGASVYVHSGPDARHDPPTHLRWTTAYIWNDAGDEA
ncbi:MAG: lamin tail domain-containing protein, partial [Anaerolineae bacterium]